ncbi:hypothetical protein Micbo1qcDRAFT_203133 [Microdochium bolleyi]|uniref:BTB domain-containing protein n=1 Tax=Microdochium bolleyi TaxID=196109 RepID=A0A136J734_9PEZI|nr:hypothetical protein Micbo1qcDRAFT_203133 [Microdochium bolleyi]
MGHSFGHRDIELLENGDFADAIVECGPQTWHVHKAIVCKRSEWFKVALDGGFMETNLAKVVIHDFEPARVDWMLKWMYSGSHGLEKLSGLPVNSLVAMVKAYLAADYFMLDDLKPCVIDVLWQDLSAMISKIQQCLTVDCMHSQISKHRGQNAETFYLDFFEGVRDIYLLGPQYDNLRQLFIEFGIRTRAATMHDDVYTELLREVPLFAFDILVQAERGARHCKDVSVVAKDAKCNNCKSRLDTDDVHAAREFYRGKTRNWTCSHCFDGVKQ